MRGINGHGTRGLCQNNRGAGRHELDISCTRGSQ